MNTNFSIYMANIKKVGKLLKMVTHYTVRQPLKYNTKDCSRYDVK